MTKWEMLNEMKNRIAAIRNKLNSMPENGTAEMAEKAQSLTKRLNELTIALQHLKVQYGFSKAA